MSELSFVNNDPMINIIFEILKQNGKKNIKFNQIYFSVRLSGVISYSKPNSVFFLKTCFIRAVGGSCNFTSTLLDSDLLYHSLSGFDIKSNFLDNFIFDNLNLYSNNSTMNFAGLGYEFTYD